MHDDVATDAGIFRAWMDATPEGAIAVDAGGAVILHTAAASRVTGLAPGVALGRAWRDVVQLDAPVADAIWRAREREDGLRLAARVMCAQGNVREVELVARPWTDGDGVTGLLLLVRDLAELARQRTAAGRRPGYGSLVGSHPSMASLCELIDAVAPSDAPVVIEGEAGTGKELVAQLLHARSSRAERPLVVVGCGALAPEALEAELFGEARGAFRGTVHSVVGRLELAHTGTLLLDEVAELPASTQRKLLRFLQSGELERLGDPTSRRVDVRVIASTSRPLAAAVHEGRVREDLYYRLKVVRLAVPPLRERASDIPALAAALLERHHRPDLALAPAALALLQSHAWPGNVRELERALRHAIAVTREHGAVIGPDQLPAELRAPGEARPLRIPVMAAREDRRAVLLRALSSHGGNRTAAARSLGIGRATFYRWWNEAGLGSGVTEASHASS